MIEITETEALAIVKIIDEYDVYEEVPMVSFLLKSLRNSLEARIAENRLKHEEQENEDSD